MRSISYILLFLASLTSFAQNRITADGGIIICYESGETEVSYIPHTARLSTDKLKNGRQEQDLTFEFIFNNAPREAIIVLRHAGEIWSNYIKSDIPIKIFVDWRDLGNGTLGSAGPSSREANFKNVPVRNTWYPIALAERLAQEEINDPDEYEISMNFNSEYPWYFGLDGAASEGTHDFLSVVLHEIGHGLGIIDTFDKKNGVGSWGIDDFPYIYDAYVHSENLEKLIDKTIYSMNSEKLGDELTSGTLVFKSDFAQGMNNGGYPLIYAPRQFSGGSSIAHLDEDTYPAGDINSLMTPQIGRQEAIHEPGPLIEGMLADMGYLWVFIDHDSIPDQREFATDIIINGTIVSDSLLLETSGKLIYSYDEFETSKEVPLIINEEQSAFSVTLPAPGEPSIAEYYFEITDITERVYRRPATSREDNYTFGYGILTPIEDLKASFSFSLYPNPSDGPVKLQIEGLTSQASLKISNIQGGLIRSLTIAKDQLITINDLNSGYYIIQMESRYGQLVKKLIIK